MMSVKNHHITAIVLVDMDLEEGKKVYTEEF